MSTPPGSSHRHPVRYLVSALGRRSQRIGEPPVPVGAVPRAADTYLVIEVADATGGHDRRVKIPRYAAAGIPEVWVFDLVAHRLEVHREPGADGYAVVQVPGPGEVATPAAFGDLTIDVGTILG